MQGMVRWWSEDKGFGFIRPDGEDEDVFAHYSAVVAREGVKQRNLRDGARVSFEVENTDKGRRATGVRELAG